MEHYFILLVEGFVLLLKLPLHLAFFLELILLFVFGEFVDGLFFELCETGDFAIQLLFGIFGFTHPIFTLLFDLLLFSKQKVSELFVNCSLYGDFLLKVVKFIF